MSSSQVELASGKPGPDKQKESLVRALWRASPAATSLLSLSLASGGSDCVRPAGSDTAALGRFRSLTREVTPCLLQASQVDVKPQKEVGGSSSSSSSDTAGGAEATPATSSDGVVAAAAAQADAMPPWSWRQFAAFCGPGLLMSVAYLVRGGAKAPARTHRGRAPEWSAHPPVSSVCP